MAKLIVKLNGQEIASLQLEPGQEYIAGRANDAQIVLPAQKGISRHHLKFVYKDEHWTCESLSKFQLIQIGNASFENLELKDNAIFSLHPFEFMFTADVAKPVNDVPAPIANPPAPYSPSPDEFAPPKFNNEATSAGVSNLAPFIRMTSNNSSEEETLKLEGHLWVGGRESNCEIHLETPHASRKHFEIVRTNEGFFITDLGSANGTILNGQRLPPHEPVKLTSGDAVSIQNINMVFEIRDVQFVNRISNLPALAPAYFEQQPQPMNWPAPSDYEEWSEPTPSDEFTGWKKHLNWKQHKVRVILAAIIPLIIIFALTDSQPTAQRNPATAPQTPGNVPFEQLTNEQKNAIKDSFSLSRNLYVQGKYELCITEVAKLHSMIPFFENSKELEEFCKQGRELVIRQKDLERKDRERALIEQQIKEIVESCYARLSKTASTEETRRCLVDAIEMDPEHPTITQALAAAQRREEERTLAEKDRVASAKRAAKGREHFSKAKALVKSGRLAKALREFESYIGTPYPDSEQNKDVARREIAAIRGQLKTKVGFYVEQCKTLGEKGRFKEAYIACDRAVEEDPSNQKAIAMRAQMLSELRREIKSVYEDSVLEESMGNVDAAKEKWNKILKDNLSFDEYTNKAKSKLQKYGIGI